MTIPPYLFSCVVSYRITDSDGVVAFFLRSSFLKFHAAWDKLSFIKGITNDIAVFHDESNQDAIMEYTLTTAPDFENQGILIDIIFQGVKKFISSINNLM